MPFEPDRGANGLEKLDPAWAWSAFQATPKDPWNLARRAAPSLYRRAGLKGQ